VKNRPLIGTSALLAAAMLIPATAASAQTTADAQACVVTDGTLSWGVKESFRSYISGTIANGSWEALDGATYETPDFTWTGATGSYDPATGTGSVSFPGTVHFTGHDGVLDLTLGNPTIEFEGDTAALLLDAHSNDMEGEVAVDAEQEWVGDVALADGPDVTDGALAGADLGTTLTNSGAAAFAGFYEAGETLDPISFTLTAEGCDAATADEPVVESTAEPVAPAVAEEPAALQPVEVNADIPWAAIGVGGVALLVIGFTGGILVGGRRKRPADPERTAVDGAA